MSHSEKVFIALAGNPNSGKTTAFNSYTGTRQHVGNYPGITVEKKEGTVHVDDKEITLVDLPGAYSLTAYSPEEVVARRVLAEEKPAAVLNIVNAAVLERNLYLTVQLQELGIPVVVALNMMDEAHAQGIQINVQRLGELLHTPVVSCVARTGQGLDKALREAMATGSARHGQEWQPLHISYGADIDTAIEQMIPLITHGDFLRGAYPARWIALKYLENDEDIITQGEKASKALSEELLAIAKKTEQHLQSTLNTYPEAVIADYRYGYIASILKQGVISRQEDRRARIDISDKIDQVLTHRILGPLILFGLLYGMYFTTFVIGEIPQGWLESLFSWMHDTVEGSMPDGLLRSLIVSGIIDGVGGVFSFVPLIMVMFLLIAALEDFGYMARVAYMSDRVFRFFGLHGASVMPFIISGGIVGGCAVPGIMATRTLRSPRERLATMLCAPFMACGAKLPVFMLFIGIFFKEHQALVMFLLTLTGWAAALLVAKLLRSTIIKGESTPFVMELPPYRLPTLPGVLIHTWERTWQYLKKAGTIIVAISILLWAAMTFPSLPEQESEVFTQAKAAITAQKETMPEEEFAAKLLTIDNEEATKTLRNSAAGRLGIALEPISRPAGFDWRTNIALIGGIAAKEVVLSTLGTAYSLGQTDPEESKDLAERIQEDPNWTRANAVALLLFTLLYSPCIVAVATIKAESGKWRWALFSIFFNLGLAYGIAVASYKLLSA